MLIKYIGHACFKVKDLESGYSVIFDPYGPDSVPGFGRILDVASEVICSHEHHDHNCREAVKIEDGGESPFEVRYIEGYHDEVRGDKRGTNRVAVLTLRSTGEKIIHYGDIGENIDEFLTEETLELVRDADIAMIPVGGYYTIDADQALELIERTTPHLAMPMHYRIATAGVGLENIGSIEEFLDKVNTAGRTASLWKWCFYDTKEYPMSDRILALRPENV